MQAAAPPNPGGAGAFQKSSGWSHTTPLPTVPALCQCWDTGRLTHSLCRRADQPVYFLSFSFSSGNGCFTGWGVEVSHSPQSPHSPSSLISPCSMSSPSFS